jgi:outer membrane receptor for ferrienterochelin and colicins
LNLFRNDVSNLINYLPVATNANSTSVFSYVNVNRAFTQGIESNIKWQLTKHINVQAGYQFLLSGDKAIVEKVNSGSVYGRDYEGGPARLMQRSDYSGLLNRSKHMANLRVFYEDAKGIQASVRAIYRSRWGVIDRDGNGFANRDDEFADAQIQVNATIGKRIAQRWTMQLGVNNLFNQIDARFMPNIPGINYFTSVIYSFKK